MRVGVATEETWDFLHEIYAYLSERHQTSLFKRRSMLRLPVFSERLNRYVFRNDLQKFMRANDVVFFEWASELLVAASRMPKTCGIVTRLHRYEMYQWVNHINWDAVDRIILVSQAKRREFVGRFPQQAGKVIVIPEAVSLTRFAYQPKPFRGNIGILCHLTPRKRVYELILAFYELTRKQDGFHLHIGGDEHPLFGDYYLALRSLVAGLGLESKVTFYGFVSKPEAWYPNVDIFISNSYSEGLQVSPMEAVASGCYLLSHRWQGVEEMLPDDYLYYTDSELVEKICRYASLSEADRLESQKRLQSIVAEYNDVEKTRVQVCQVIEDAGQKKGMR